MVLGKNEEFTTEGAEFAEAGEERPGWGCTEFRNGNEGVYPPRCFAKSEKVASNQWVADLWISGVRKLMKMKRLPEGLE